MGTAWCWVFFQLPYYQFSTTSYTGEYRGRITFTWYKIQQDIWFKKMHAVFLEESLLLTKSLFWQSNQINRRGVTNHHLNFFYDLFTELWGMFEVFNLEKLDWWIFSNVFAYFISQDGAWSQDSLTEYTELIILLPLFLEH